MLVRFGQRCLALLVLDLQFRLRLDQRPDGERVAHPRRKHQRRVAHVLLSIQIQLVPQQHLDHILGAPVHNSQHQRSGTALVLQVRIRTSGTEHLRSLWSATLGRFMQGRIELLCLGIQVCLAHDEPLEDFPGVGLRGTQQRGPAFPVPRIRIDMGVPHKARHYAHIIPLCSVMQQLDDTLLSGRFRLQGLPGLPPFGLDVQSHTVSAGLLLLSSS
mmetsp:Transcript_10308/g.21739  ORF Transcript_10308/g.21739 Transcript_10308/m.21739 type:complete len:216 (+) Transcript_10308:170-817(+)